MKRPMTRQTWVIGAAAAALVVAGCSSGEQAATESSSAASPTVSSSGTAAPAPVDEAHNDADVTFVQHMIPHHQQAVEMSDIVLAKQDVDPRVIDLAKKIKAEQGPEIAQMQEWLAKWGSPSTPAAPSEHEGHGGQPGHSEPMVGMMSEEDMTALRNASGPDAGPVYLGQMIGHHEGAITMAQDEVDNGEFPGAVELATKIITAQKAEIDTMREILKTL